MEYRMPRLAGVGREMSRLGGGINTRGPGESKLESDRQVIRRRIQDLKERLDKDENVFVLDVREREEWDIVHLPFAKLIPLSELGDRLGELRGKREAVAGAAQNALAGPLGAEQIEAVDFILGRIESALRARAVANA